MSETERAITAGLVVPASIEDVWKAWTTEEGVKSFFAPDCWIELSIGGAYEMYFNPDAKPGEKGGEGVTIIAISFQEMLSFTWNAPPSLPEIRRQLTHVTIRLQALNENRTLVKLHHDGWGEGEIWDKTFDYFENAWKRIVLPRLKYRFETGPVDWNNPPELPAIT